ncbi:unnamed protein product [Camellia sinensis]
MEMMIFKRTRAATVKNATMTKRSPSRRSKAIGGGDSKRLGERVHKSTDPYAIAETLPPPSHSTVDTTKDLMINDRRSAAQSLMVSWSSTCLLLFVSTMIISDQIHHDHL